MSKSQLPQFSIRQLIEAGFHFGHKTMRRNPKMSKYIHTSRNGVSIIDLNKTAQMLHSSLKIVKEIAKNNGRILFIATKKQAIEPVAEAAKRSGQYFVNFRWLGGMLTNWKTVSQSIKTLKKVEEQLSDTEIGYNKKEKLDLERQRLKLEQNLGGIKNMGGYPDLVVVIDTNKESLAIAEAKKLNIPIMALVDTNCNPDNISFVVPGNDDSAKSIKLFCHLISDAIIAGIKENMIAQGLDISKLSGDEIANNINDLKKSDKKDEKSFRTEKKPAKKSEESLKEKSEDDEKKVPKKSKLIEKKSEKSEVKIVTKKTVSKKTEAKK
ncbi:MAG: 30S ribosomal protein S2 [Proteobacteria bacterium]|nr:30S ribosomal protein S2 [Pseudomonadota bacterium]NCA28188.1 30S ribosomal protein S2 [Pseudomonadota bacterium]